METAMTETLYLGKKRASLVEMESLFTWLTNENYMGIYMQKLLIELLNSGWVRLDGNDKVMLLGKSVEGSEKHLCALLDISDNRAYFFDKKTLSVPKIGLRIYDMTDDQFADVMQKIHELETTQDAS
jgi:hypothetical protein